MIKIRLFPSLVLIAVLLAACAPRQSTVSSSPTANSVISTSTPVVQAPTEARPPSTLPVATSRGPELHATDPQTVDLASGGLQLVEFFRFT